MMGRPIDESPAEDTASAPTTEAVETSEAPEPEMDESRIGE